MSEVFALLRPVARRGRGLVPARPLASLLLAGALLPATAAAQQAPAAGAGDAAAARQQLEEMSRQGGPLAGGVARANRMTDPNAGKRPGDDKLGCEQIKAEFDDTRQKYTAQRAKQDASRAAAEAEGRQAQADGSGVKGVASGFLGGLGAVAAHATGNGDAYNEKLKAEAIATQKQREDLQNQFARDAEASKALSDRGRALVALGSAKGCKGVSFSQ